ncbi:MAG: MBL fold metallo-hydrolase [Prevotella sp.]|jgi:phosphoribosyl 1,2-cyclic phosphodiesterase|uniref:MBL fold metallo-hydrolase n=1 Tax=Prevotella sp. E13-27 TaxID=2938122 RepID=UPI002009EA6A|nr:MBL fold metallo-hydrolase [Prevotella sp. E13-27]MBR4565318.1 MBL fold metallo-hydrolase [Prevotella sp.]MCK8623481.1 MBL fold metallo-hydrolase [Prevotella sp. E13-27]
MLNFISFGSGSSGNCYFIYTEKEGLLIDVGVGIRTLKKNFKDYGLSLTQIHHVFITHDHADHIKSVGSISHDYHLPIYATEAVHEGIDRNYCVARKITSQLRRYVVPGESINLDDVFKVTPFAVPHDSSENVGYFVEHDDKNICIITDAGMVTEEMKSFISKAQYLVIEANHDIEMLQQGPYPQHLKERILSGTGHLSNNACGEALANNMSEKLKHVWLCHLSEENNHPELARKTVETILRSYGIVVGKDLELEVLKRTNPTGLFEL